MLASAHTISVCRPQRQASENYRAVPRQRHGCWDSTYSTKGKAWKRRVKGRIIVRPTPRRKSLLAVESRGRRGETLLLSPIRLRYTGAISSKPDRSLLLYDPGPSSHRSHAREKGFTSDTDCGRGCAQRPPARRTWQYMVQTVCEEGREHWYNSSTTPISALRDWKKKKKTTVRGWDKDQGRWRFN